MCRTFRDLCKRRPSLAVSHPHAALWAVFGAQPLLDLPHDPDEVYASGRGGTRAARLGTEEGARKGERGRGRGARESEKRGVARVKRTGEAGSNMSSDNLCT